MPGLVPGIHVFVSSIDRGFKTWMAGTSPAMTLQRITPYLNGNPVIHGRKPAHRSITARNNAYHPAGFRRLGSPWNPMTFAAFGKKKRQTAQPINAALRSESITAIEACPQCMKCQPGCRLLRYRCDLASLASEGGSMPKAVPQFAQIFSRGLHFNGPSKKRLPQQGHRKCK